MAGFQQLVDLNFVLEGVTPVLQNNPDAMDDDPTGPSTSKPKTIDPPEVAAAKRRYLDAHGNLQMPSSAVFRAAVDGGSHIKIAKVTRLSTLVAGALYPVELWFPLTDAQGEPLTRYEVDRRRVVNNATGSGSRQGGSVKRSRPLIHLPWLLRCHMLLDIALVEPQIVGKVLETAGAKLGIGDFRPQKKGWFGRFRVKEFVVGGEDITAQLA